MGHGDFADVKDLENFNYNLFHRRQVGQLYRLMHHLGMEGTEMVELVSAMGKVLGTEEVEMLDKVMEKLM